jgi:hypothetical protein
MTELLQDDERFKLIGAAVSAGDSFLPDGTRQLRLAALDRAFAASLPRRDDDLSQFRSDFETMGGLPYLVTHEGQLQVPLAQYLQASAVQLGPRMEAQIFAEVSQSVQARAGPAIQAVTALLSALAAAVSKEALVGVAGGAGVDLSGFDLDRTPVSVWALALHVAARDGRLDQFLQAAGGAAPSPDLAAALAQRPEWGPAVRDASPAHLLLEEQGGAPAITWDRVFAAARTATERSIADLTAKVGDRSVVYDAATFEVRAALDQRLAEFLASPARVLIVTGEAGSGKTCLVAHWAEQLLAGGHAVVMVRGATLGGTDVWGTVARALGMDAATWLDQVGPLASDARRSVAVVVDGANEVVGAGGPLGLFDQVNGRLDDVPAGVHVVITLTDPSWRRIARQRAAAISGAYYFQPEGGGDIALTVTGFDDAELEAAWTKYRQKNAIPTPLNELPMGLRRQLRNPSMMELVAETFAGGAVPQGEVEAAIGLFQAYYRRKTLEGGQTDQEFLRQLALAIYTLKLLPVPEGKLQDLDAIKGYLDTNAPSPYLRMLDEAVLRQVDVAPNVPPAAVEYAISRFGAWVLAGALRMKYDTRLEAVGAAADCLPDFPPIADTVRLLLQWPEPPAVAATELTELAGDRRPEVRDMVAEALAEMSGREADFVSDQVNQLVGSAAAAGGRERQRVGLRAAYLVTEGEFELDLTRVFTDIAKGDDAVLRQETQNMLYLTWRRHPRFVYDLMARIADTIELIKPLQARRLVEFLGSLSITLYTSHPGWEVGKPTSDLWYGVAVQRLHITTVASPAFAPVRALAFAVGNKQFSERILRGFLVDDPRSVDRVFRLDDAAKAPFVQSLDLLDPAGVVDDAATDSLATLLGSDLDVFRLLAAQVLAVHAVVNFAGTASVVGGLWDRLDQGGRLWLSTAFCSLLETTPPQWVGMLEDLTRRTATAHPEVLDGLDAGYLGKIRLDQLLFPLALAYAKQGAEMPLLHEFVVDGLGAGKRLRVARCLRAMGRVGFHYPAPVLAQLAAWWDVVGKLAGDPGDPRNELVTALATIRLLHLDEVDDFLLDVEASPAFGAAVRGALREGVDDKLIYDQVTLLGLYTNGVHQAVCFPKMRNGLLIPIYRLLATEKSLRTAVRKLTRDAWDMLVVAGFKVENWMEPASPDGPCR